MGLSESKLRNKSDKTAAKCSKNLPLTPIQSEKLDDIENLSELDPRSPSENVIRTPIEVSKSTAKINEDNISSLIRAVDPRSPSDEFCRTPIFLDNIIPTQPPSKLHNKILDNARRSLLYSPTVSSRTQTEFKQVKHVQTPPKLLESSPTIRKKISHRRSFVGLLETNIDYTETDLDSYIKTNSLDSSLSININENDNVIDCNSCDPRSPSTDFLRTPIQIVIKPEEIQTTNRMNNSILVGEITNVDCNESDSLLKVVDVSPEVNYITEEVRYVHEDEIDKNTEENNLCRNFEDCDIITAATDISIDESKVDSIEAMSNDLLVLDENEMTPDLLKPTLSENIEPVIDLTADVQEFDRKLTKFIRENDENIIFHRTSKMGDNEQPRNRTPMKDRNLITEPKKTKLKVSDKPRKLEYAVNKIPVFRENRGKLKIQCENTPPKNMERRKKSHQAKWDSEKTMVI